MNLGKKFQLSQGSANVVMIVFVLAVGSAFAAPVGDNLKNTAPPASSGAKSKPSAPVKEKENIPAEGGTYEVIAAGVGSTKETAIKDGLRDAVNQVVGILIISKDRVENDQLIESKVLTYCDGFVESYKLIGEPTKDGSLVKIRMKAIVRKGKLTDSLQSAGISTREIDAGSMMGEAITVSTQKKSAVEMTTELFDGFPSNVYKAEALTAFKVSGDEDGIVIEVPVKVSIDLAKWKAWADKADKVLGAIALAKSSIKWNLKDSALCPLTVARKEFASGQSNKQKKPSAIMSSFDDNTKGSFQRFVGVPFFKLLIPDSCASGAVLCYNPQFSLPITKYTVTILDAPSGKSRAYQLPEDCFNIADHARILCPTIDIELQNKDGQILGSKIVGWSQSISAQTNDQEDQEVFKTGCGQGGRTVWVNSHQGINLGALPSLPSWDYGGGSWHHVTHRNEFIYVPGLTGHWSQTSDNCTIITSSGNFPYRFRLDAAETAANPQPTVSVSIGNSEPLQELQNGK